jgi:hypothetical protein
MRRPNELRASPLVRIRSYAVTDTRQFVPLPDCRCTELTADNCRHPVRRAAR